MKFPKEMLYYDCLSNFKSSFYKALLTQDNLVGTELKINKLDFPDGSSKDRANFWGWQLEKNGIKYLLPSRDDRNNQINVYDLLPFIAEDLEKVSAKGVVYFLIRKPITAKLRPLKTMTFKQLVDVLSNLQHTNPTHQKLWWFIGLTSMMDRANFRLSTPPGFGKDSVVDTLGCLIGSAATIENPTIAKLEFMTMYKWLVVNEINDIPKAEWKIIEQFLLAVGAHKPESTKHSRAQSGGVKETLNLKEFSISLTYNDINNYKAVKEYMDFVSKTAVLDRFPAFRLVGSITEDFNKPLDVQKIVKENFDNYKELAYNISYYKLNKAKELKRFEVKGLKIIKSRWKTNIGRLLQTIDLYCENQEEFNEWVEVINNSLEDYEQMLLFKNISDKYIAKVESLPDIEQLKIIRRFEEILLFKDKNKFAYEIVFGKIEERGNLGLWK